MKVALNGQGETLNLKYIVFYTAFLMLLHTPQTEPSIIKYGLGGMRR